MTVGGEKPIESLLEQLQQRVIGGVQTNRNVPDVDDDAGGDAPCVTIRPRLRRRNATRGLRTAAPAGRSALNVVDGDADRAEVDVGRRRRAGHRRRPRVDDDSRNRRHRRRAETETSWPWSPAPRRFPRSRRRCGSCNGSCRRCAPPTNTKSLLRQRAGGQELGDRARRHGLRCSRARQRGEPRGRADRVPLYGTRTR